MSEKNNSVEQFMMDLNFREWALNPTKETDQFWKVWMQNNPEKNKDLLLAKELIRKLEFRQADASQDLYDRVLQKTLAGQQAHTIRDNHRTLRYSGLKVYLRIAAVFVLACFMYLFYQTTFNSAEVATLKEKVVKENLLGRKSQIYLPDGTVVWLNAGSKIEYAKNFVGNARLIQLSGEAYFDVAKDKSKPFVVETTNILVTAIGTEFNVRAFSDDLGHEVLLAEGKVMVKGATDNIMKEGKAYLNPGESLSVSKSTGESVKSKFDTKKALAWKDGIIYFDDASFTEVIDVLHRWYGKEFIVKNQGKAGSWKFGSEFHNETLENVLRTISYSKDFEYIIEEDTVTIIF